MYKIHINDTPLTIVSGKDGNDYNQAMQQGSLVAPFPGKKKFLLHYIDLLEKSKDHPGVVLVASDIEDAIQLMESLFQLVEAAGGIVRDPSGKILWIYRREIWDLPKGKIEKGEKPEVAALREVEEETGLSDLALVRPLAVTRHTYKESNKRILKLTHWYEMLSDGESAVPQEEEDITLVKWMTTMEYKEASWSSFRTIHELVDHYLHSSARDERE